MDIPTTQAPMAVTTLRRMRSPLPFIEPLYDRRPTSQRSHAGEERLGLDRLPRQKNKFAHGLAGRPNVKRAMRLNSAAALKYKPTQGRPP